MSDADSETSDDTIGSGETVTIAISDDEDDALESMDLIHDDDEIRDHEW